MAKPSFLPESVERTRKQATAPENHAWVSANAGSGKTAILKDRVMRLLLDGVPPDRILCLTYTRAAAAEMQGRIFSELAGWTALDDSALASAIDKLCGVDPARHAKRHARARSLFAEALETPGGLKIQTIHAFAERILHLFPIEAGVPFDFAMLDEAERAAMVEEARRQVLDAALAFPESGLGRAFRTITAATGVDGFGTVVDLAIRTLARLAMRQPDVPVANLLSDARFASVLGVESQRSVADIAAEFEAALPDRRAIAQMAERITALQPKKPTKLYERSIACLLRLAAALEPQSLLDAAIDFVFTASREKPRDDLVDTATSNALPEIVTEIQVIRAATVRALDQRRLLQTSERSRALATFAGAVLERVEAAKSARAVLDFDDLIARLAALLRRGAAAWVMRKLDGAIEHILVDEAQDTTPEMWEIIRKLAEEFFAGEGQSRYRRTLFVVGDEKQSIFSFQGARPHVFDEVRHGIVKNLPKKNDDAPDQNSNLREPVALRYSFRSSGDVLEAIDRVFAGENARGLSARDANPQHLAADDHMAGLVECWPPVLAPPKGEAGDPPAKPIIAPEAISARQVAESIALMLEGGFHLSDGKPIRPGDILVLTRQRNGFFNGLIRELRQRGIPVAGADRLKLEGEIVIHDLLAIAQAALLPADDLSLAAALKSPLFGLDDRALERLCRARTGTLREAIRAGADDPRLRAIDQRLETLEAAARTLSPYAFFARILIEPVPGDAGLSGRKAIARRLGPDAHDPLDAFLGQALEYGLEHPPTLAGFLHQGQAGALEIKRDLDAGAGQVRVMTVHASKGLEARIVIIGDAMRMPDKRKEPVCFLSEDGNGVLLWHGAKRDEPEIMREARARDRTLLLEEHRRLLYVAMTRASERLILTGYQNKPPSKKSEEKPPLETDWLTLARKAFAEVEQVERIPSNFGEGDILRWKGKRQPQSAQAETREPGMPPVNPPPWLSTPLQTEASASAPLSPSRLGARGITAQAEEARESAMRLGSLLHHLLDTLPRVEQAHRAKLGQRLIAEALPHLPEAQREMALNAVLAVIDAPQTARFFAPDARIEVPVAGAITLQNGEIQPVNGRLDRLLVRGSEVEILDIKTGKPGFAADNAAILSQMALYRHIIAGIFPGKAITAHILWLQAQRLEALEPAALNAALATITER